MQLVVDVTETDISVKRKNVENNQLAKKQLSYFCYINGVYNYIFLAYY